MPASVYACVRACVRARACMCVYLVIESYMNLSVQCKRAVCWVARHSGSVSVRSQGRQCFGMVAIREMCWVGRQSGNVLGRSPVRQCVGQVAVHVCVRRNLF